MKSQKSLQYFLMVILVAISVFSSSHRAAAQMGDSIRGWFSIIWGDGYAGSGEAIRYTLTDDNGQATVLSIDEELGQAMGGVLSFNRKYVEVEGYSAYPLSGQGTSEAFNVASMSLISSPLSGKTALGIDVAPAVSGSKPWVTIMCKFSDKSDEPNDLTYFQGMYANTKPGLDHYWRELSYDTVDVSGSSASGWFNLPNPVSHYNPTDTEKGTDLILLAQECIIAANASVDFSTYSGINMMFNDDFDNGWAWGGGVLMTLDGVERIWSVTWEPPWSYNDIMAISHEMGHGFGLPHSSGNYGETYDNVWDVMSNADYNCGTAEATDPTYGCLGQHTIAYHKDMLGWIPAGQKYTGVGSVTIDPLSLATTTHYSMAQIPIGGSATHFYTVEVREKSGYDVKLPDKAVIIHEVDTTRLRPAYVIDADGNGDTEDAGAMWGVGENFTDAANGISVEVLSATANGFQVSIMDSSLLPSPPSVFASKGTDADKVSVTWSSVGDADSYLAYRCTSAATDTCSEIYDGDLTEYEDTEAAENTLHYYRVKACNTIGCSGYSSYSTGYKEGTVVPDNPSSFLPAIKLLL